MLTNLHVQNFAIIDKINEEGDAHMSFETKFGKAVKVEKITRTKNKPKTSKEIGSGTQPACIPVFLQYIYS